MAQIPMLMARLQFGLLTNTVRGVGGRRNLPTDGHEEVPLVASLVTDCDARGGADGS